jgi:protein-disulfide isomerase
MTAFPDRFSTLPDEPALQATVAPLDEKIDHVHGSPDGRLIVEYGDYECPYSRQAFHAIEQVERQLGGNLRFAFRHFPLTGIHVAAFGRDRTSSAVAGRIRRDVDSGLASRLVLGTPTLFIDGVVHRGGYDPPALLAALAS